MHTTQLIIYQFDTVPVSIIDLNKKAQLHTHLQVNNPYIAPCSETYISLRNQEQRTCKILDMNFIVKNFS